MNICFFSGVIVTKPIFKFIISSNLSLKHCNHISICLFEIKLNNGTKVKIKAYDDLADYCYRNLRTGDYITVSRIFI